MIFGISTQKMSKINLSGQKCCYVPPLLKNYVFNSFKNFAHYNHITYSIYFRFFIEDTVAELNNKYTYIASL